MTATVSPGTRIEPIRERARAKLNLFLHVCGRRADGLHLIESLVVFAEVCDEITLYPTEGDGPVVTRTGPGAGALPGIDEDIAVRAARRMAGQFGRRLDIRLDLEKRLPVAAGIGGGSADAAAVMRALCRYWGIDRRDPALAGVALALGADVPVCLDGRPARVRGIGDVIEPVSGLPAMDVVLANPGVALATADVFAAYAGAAPPSRDESPSFDVRPGEGMRAFVRWLGGTRNDLHRAAAGLCPAIDEVLEALAARSGCRFARMSGSGATCYAIFDSPAAARAGAAAIAMANPHWWVEVTVIRPDSMAWETGPVAGHTGPTS